MRRKTLLSGYILRVAVERNRWPISLFTPTPGEVVTFDSFEALGAYFEQMSIQHALFLYQHISETLLTRC